MNNFCIFRHCTLDGRRHVNIEMQGLNIDNAYDRRAEYQAAHLLNHTVRRGMKWRETPEVYQVSVLNFIYDKESDSGVSEYRMRRKDGKTLSGRMAIVFVELPKYSGESERVEDLTAAEKWCKFLLYADDSARHSLVEEICRSEGGIMAASGILTKISQDDVNWLRQTNRDLWERDQLSIKGYVEELTQDVEELTQDVEELTQELAESQAVIEEKDAVIEEKDAVIEEKDAVIEEKDTALAEKDAQLLAQMREIESLRAKLENKKAAV